VTKIVDRCIPERQQNVPQKGTKRKNLKHKKKEFIMNIFVKGMTLGFVLALLVAGIIGYGGMKKKAIPLYAEEFGQQSSFAVFIQDLKAFAENIQPAMVGYDYSSSIDFPLPIAFSGIDERPF